MPKSPLSCCFTDRSPIERIQKGHILPKIPDSRLRTFVAAARDAFNGNQKDKARQNHFLKADKRPIIAYWMAFW
jgi:hypothetical protein